MNTALTASLPAPSLIDELQAFTAPAPLNTEDCSETTADSPVATEGGNPAPRSASDPDALQHWISTDRANPEIGCGFGELLEMPLHLRNPGIAAQVWNAWYGNARQANRVMELLLKVRSPETAFFARPAQRPTPALVLSMLLGNPRLAERLVQQLPPGEQEQVDPHRRLISQLRNLIGPSHDELPTSAVSAAP